MFQKSEVEIPKAFCFGQFGGGTMSVVLAESREKGLQFVDQKFGPNYRSWYNSEDNETDTVWIVAPDEVTAKVAAGLSFLLAYGPSHPDIITDEEMDAIADWCGQWDGAYTTQL